MLEIIGRRDPDCVADEAALREALRAFYPWRFPEVVHEHLNDPDDWWAALQPGLATAAVAAGLDPLDADAVAAEVRSCYGYEKPHPRSIGLALEYFEVDVAWMIGDSARSDTGADDAAGIPSVLVVRDRPAPLVETATLVRSAS